MKHQSVIVAAVLPMMAAMVCGQAAPEPVPTSELRTSVQPTGSPTPIEQLEPPTSQQITGDVTAYDKYCAGCHGSNLTDGIAPKLTKSALARYGTAQQLFRFIQQTMPKGDAGSLSEQQYYGIVEYLLSRQGLLEPGQAVSAKSAAGIVLSE